MRIKEGNRLRFTIAILLLSVYTDNIYESTIQRQNDD
jgi:hypothetical protein